MEKKALILAKSLVTIAKVRSKSVNFSIKTLYNIKMYYLSVKYYTFLCSHDVVYFFKNVTLALQTYQNVMYLGTLQRI